MMELWGWNKKENKLKALLGFSMEQVARSFQVIFNIIPSHV